MEYSETIDQHCDGCHRQFTLGDTIYICHLWLSRKDLCELCKDKLLAFIETLSNGTTIMHIS